MPRGVANTIQITFMELKVPRPKLEDVGNAKAVTVKIAENVPHVKTNQNLEAVEQKSRPASTEFVRGRILLEKELHRKHQPWLQVKKECLQVN